MLDTLLSGIKPIHNTLDHKLVLRMSKTHSGKLFDSIHTNTPSSIFLGRFYRPELDALRFVAFLCVFACHALPLPASGHSATFEGPAWRVMQVVRETGNFGVSLFFVLSAFLITELMRREREATLTVHLKAFYLRRLLRIWPLYFFIILFCVSCGRLVPFLHMLPGQVLANLLFSGNWYFVVYPNVPTPLSYLWSISVEEQFYIIWPSIVKVCQGSRIKVLGVSLGYIPLSAITIFLVTRFSEHPDITVWFNSAVQFQFFALGAIIAVGLQGSVPQLAQITRVALASAGILCWVAASGVCQIKAPGVKTGPWLGVLGYELVALGCTLLFFATFGISSRRVPVVLGYLGKISYGLYMFHVLALFATTALRKAVQHGNDASLALYAGDRVLALALTVGLSVFSYKFLETPFLRLKDRFAYVHSRAV